jgi:hypothetical protein
LPVFVDLRQGLPEVLGFPRPEHDDAMMPQPVDREAQRGSVRALEAAMEQHVHAAELGLLPTELDHFVVVRKALLHRALELGLEIEGLKFRRDLRGDHQTLRLGRRVTIAPEQFLERARPFFQARVLQRQILFRKKKVRLEPELRVLVGYPGQFGAGLEKGLAVSIGVIQAEQSLLAPKHDLQNSEAVERSRRGLEQCFAVADHALVGPAFPDR